VVWYAAVQVVARSFFYAEESIMRLDKFLKVSRIIKRRTVAKEACDGGRVSLNGRVAKAGAEVREGDILEIRFGSRLGRYGVNRIQEVVRKDQAAEMYRVIQEDEETLGERNR
jgi:ribosomal 50S subunit-recycling heat shock protein